MVGCPGTIIECLLVKVDRRRQEVRMAAIQILGDISFPVPTKAQALARPDLQDTKEGWLPAQVRARGCP